jgi:hypothetical protein
MKNGIFIIGIVFAATLAYVVGNRLSSEAMAVVVGALCGISASVPVSVALYIAASKNWGRETVVEARAEEMDRGPRSYPASPPFVVISPPAQVPYPYPGSQMYLPPQAPAQGAPREFKIIGEE